MIWYFLVLWRKKNFGEKIFGERIIARSGRWHASRFFFPFFIAKNWGNEIWGQRKNFAIVDYGKFWQEILREKLWQEILQEKIAWARFTSIEKKFFFFWKRKFEFSLRIDFWIDCLKILQCVDFWKTDRSAFDLIVYLF